MRISFDLDDTLICYSPDIPREPQQVPLWWKWRTWEPLRLGAAPLLRELQTQHELWIYTTSYHESREVKRWLRFYGIRIQRVINADTHAHEVPSREWSELSASPPCRRRRLPRFRRTLRFQVARDSIVNSRRYVKYALAPHLIDSSFCLGHLGQARHDR